MDAMIYSRNFTDEWRDVKRDRDVPVRVFLPDAEIFPTPCPVVLLSHGLGGSRDGFGYLGEHWADGGYVVIVLQHPGSDLSIFSSRKPGEKPQQVMLRAVNPQTAQDRYDDVVFVLDELEKISSASLTLGDNRIAETLRQREHESPAKDKLAGRLDLGRVGMAGHSFGSQTTLAVVGRLPYRADERIKSAIVFSPNKTRLGDQKRIHASIRTPIMHLTGTKDESPLTKDFDPKDRQIPFQNIAGPDQYLVVFNGGNHMLFSGHKRPFGLSTMEKCCQPLIAEMTRKFFDAYLCRDDKAKEWLRTKGLTEMMKEHGTVTIKS